MNYIIGSGFSGLTVAYALYKKGIKSTIISPADGIKKKNSSLLRLIFKKNGEILNNSKSFSKEINKINKSNVKNCKYLISHLDGGQSNFWGGIIGNIYEYDLSEYLVNRKDLLKNSILFKRLLKIIGIKYENFFKYQKKQKKKISEIEYDVSKRSVSNLKKFLKKNKINFIDNSYVKKINSRNSTIEVHNLLNKKKLQIKYENLFLSCGPIETSKLILNSFNSIKKIIVKETQHFYAILKVKKNFLSRFFNISINNYKFSCQLYSLKNILGIFFKKYFKNIKQDKKSKYFIAQCYLDEKYSSKIELRNIKNYISIKGVYNKKFKSQNFNNEIKNFNKNNSSLEIKKIFLNSIGSSNHLGASIPMTKKKSVKLGVDKYGRFNGTKNIFITDSSVLNKIDVSPITIFSLNNIFRMIIDNRYIKNAKTK